MSNKGLKLIIVVCSVILFLVVATAIALEIYNSITRAMDEPITGRLYSATFGGKMYGCTGRLSFEGQYMTCIERGKQVYQIEVPEEMILLTPMK